MKEDCALISPKSSFFDQKISRETLEQANRLVDFSAIILDLDGLVLDTETTYCIAWQQAASNLGYKLSDQFCRSLSGHHYQILEKKLLEKCGAKFPLKRFRSISGNYWREYVAEHGIAVKDGFEQLLGVIDNYAVTYCLATNNSEFGACECLEMAGIRHLFPTIITRDHVKDGKPAPDIFIKAAEQLKINLKESLIVEDSHTGLLAARRAGAYSVLVPSILPVAHETAEIADLVLNNLAELAILIQAKFTKTRSDIV